MLGKQAFIQIHTTNQLAFIQIHYESVSIHPNTLRILLGALLLFTPHLHLHAQHWPRPRYCPQKQKALWRRRRHFLVQKRLPESSCSSASKYLYKTHYYPRTRVFFSSILWGRSTSDHLQEDLAKFGYRSKSKVEFFWNPIGTMYTNALMRRGFVFFSILWGRLTSDHSQEDLAKFGYSSKSEVEFFGNSIGTYVPATCKNLWSKHGYFNSCFFP